MSKEILKPNEVGAPTLFIGVGGTGSKIVKMVAEMCAPEELENINFVCLDTNVNDLKSVKKSKANIYYIQTSNTQTVGDYLDYDDDARRHWFPKNSVMYDKTVSEGAGQVRAISRLAFNSTIKTGNIAPLYAAIDDLFKKSGQDLRQALRIAFASTASGGTGSGILLPLAMFIRDYVKDKYPNTALIERALVLLPETLDSVISSTTERESQRRNAYATIKEINAFMMKGSGFFDIDPDLKRYSDLHVDFTMAGAQKTKSLALLPFDFCFLMDGQDASDSTLISFDQYKKQAALALYEQNIGPMQGQAFSVEDNIIKELSSPGNLGRNRFGGIGASAIKYPYEDVADYVAYGWAMDAIGGDAEAAKWARYDKKYELKVQECRKKGMAGNEVPTRAQVYTEELESGMDPFSKELQGKCLDNADDRLDEYFTALKEHMNDTVKQYTPIANAATAANELADQIDYKDESKKGKAKANLELLRDYEMAVNSYAKKISENEAGAIFSNENKTINEKLEYMIETLLRNTFGEIVHPNGARYFLYRAQMMFKEKIEETKSTITSQITPTLELYHDDAHSADTFDVKGTKKKKEVSLDDLAKAEASLDDGLITKLGLNGRDEIYKKLNDCFTDYYSNISSLADAISELSAYQTGYEYLDEINKMYEKFFGTFKDKVEELRKKQDDLIDALKYVKGDSVLNVCATREILNELAKSTQSIGSNGGMLNSELNAQIFDAVKANVRFERENRFADVIEDDKRIDIFDDILLGYFKQSVRDDCDTLDVNIIQAIGLEKRILARIAKREEIATAGKKEQLVDRVTSDDLERHIKDVVAKGKNLAAPGIQKIRNEEPREINVIAYNKSLDLMREYRVSDILNSVASGIGKESCDTVSKYELHFFCAMYNLTPDKLNKFAAPDVAETRIKNAGLYHTAYQEYSKKLGPDSTKNMMISTHIDKRWDSISVMPEMDLNFQAKQMMKIHQALIYALVFKAIQYRYLSVATGGKKVYRYENSEERTQELIVSNGTLCDEFYEILDSLYIDQSVVEDIYEIVKKKQERDLVRNSDYDKTEFAKAVREFSLESLHDGAESGQEKTSLFEIPLAYYNSLPNSQRFVGEIAALVEAVIDIFHAELLKWENPVDAKFLLCNILREQFSTLMTNYAQYPALNGNRPASENVVIDTIFRKIRRVISTTPEPDDYEVILDEMKSMIK